MRRGGSSVTVVIGIFHALGFCNKFTQQKSSLISTPRPCFICLADPCENSEPISNSAQNRRSERPARRFSMLRGLRSVDEVLMFYSPHEFSHGLLELCSLADLP